jgi:membrane-associated phospholipid phosphatase
MAFALVYTAEHYLVDILLGWAYTLIALWAVFRVDDWLRERRRASPARST